MFKPKLYNPEIYLDLKMTEIPDSYFRKLTFLLHYKHVFFGYEKQEKMLLACKINAKLSLVDYFICLIAIKNLNKIQLKKFA